mmetsp:Transcript_11903/g.34357  ORF Transcript_11903/g.34357 Transcript_11903/m.34357 type:complete len:81 (+) Transcript_11903:553-795(+)
MGFLLHPPPLSGKDALSVVAASYHEHALVSYDRVISFRGDNINTIDAAGGDDQARHLCYQQHTDIRIKRQASLPCREMDG